MMMEPPPPLPPGIGAGAGGSGSGGGPGLAATSSSSSMQQGGGRTAAALRMLEAIVQLTQDPRRARDPAAVAALLASVAESAPEPYPELLALRAREQQWRAALAAARAEARRAAEAEAEARAALEGAALAAGVEREQALAPLRAEVAALQGERAALRGTVEAERAECERLKLQVGEARAEGEGRVGELAGELEAVTTSYQELQEKLEQAHRAAHAAGQRGEERARQLQREGEEQAAALHAQLEEQAAAAAAVAAASATSVALAVAAAVAGKDEEVAALRTELAAAKREGEERVLEASGQGEALGRELSEARAQLRAAQEEAGALRTRLDAAGAEAAGKEEGLTTELRAAQAQVAALQEENAALKDEARRNGELALEVESLRARLAAAEEEGGARLEEAQGRLVVVEGEKAGLVERLAAADAALVEVKQQMTTAKAAATASDGEAAAALAAAEEGKRAAEAAVVETRALLAAAEEGQRAASAELEGLKGRLDEASARATSLEGEVAALRQSVAAEGDAAREEAVDLRRQLEAAESATAAAKAEGQEKDAALADLSARVTAAEASAGALEEVKAQLAVARDALAGVEAAEGAAVAEAKRQLAEAQAAATAASEEAEGLRTRLEAAEAAAAQRIADLEKRVQMVEDAKDAVAAGAAEVQQRLRQEREAAVAALEGEVGRLKAEVEALWAENEGLRRASEEDEEAAGGARPVVGALNPYPSLAPALSLSEFAAPKEEQAAEVEPHPHPPLPLPRASSAPAAPTRLLLIETGAWSVRAGLVYLDPATLKPARFEAASFPCVVARPKQPGADCALMVRNAGVRADPMYDRFRAAGVFVGKNAWYCAFEHPDAALRGKLKLEGPWARDRLPRPADLTWLWRDVMERLEVDPRDTPVLLLYKPSIPPRDQAAFARAAFDACEQHAAVLANSDNDGDDGEAASDYPGCKVRFLAEPLALLAARGVAARTALVVDVGEEGTRVVPIYENMVLGVRVQTTPLGGRDLTAYLASMLDSCTTDPYSAQPLRRRLGIARLVKERHAYVAGDFVAEAERAGGTFQREALDVMKFKRDEMLVQDDNAPGKRVLIPGADRSSSGSGSGSPRTDGKDAAAAAVVTCTARLPDGSALRFRVGKERFHCAELLFDPALFRGDEAGEGPEGAAADAQTPTSLPDLILRALSAFDAGEDADVQAAMLAHLCLAGHTTRLPGFARRLEAELRARLSPRLAAALRILPLEERAADDDGAAAAPAAIPERRQAGAGGEDGGDDDDDLLPSPSAAFSASAAAAARKAEGGFGSAVAQAAAAAADRVWAAEEAWFDSAEWADGRDCAEVVENPNFSDGLDGVVDG